MKKIVSGLLACTLAVMMSFSSLSIVQAKQQTHEEFLQEVEIKLKNAGKYAFGNENFTVNKSVYFLNYIRSGATVTQNQKDQFLSDLKNNLDTNNGKIMITDSTWEQDENGNWIEIPFLHEDIGAYGAIILILKSLKIDPSDFEGYDIKSIFESMNLAVNSTNPYYYRVAIEAADSSYKEKLVDKFINENYTLGKGMYYYEYSCDNTSMFLTAIATIKDDYKEYVEDAKSLIQTYEKENGLAYDTKYNASADSTAYGMMAFSSIGKVDKAYHYYSLLINNFESNNSGVFVNGDGEPDVTSTTNAAISLYYFKELIKNGDHVYTVVSHEDATCNHDGKEVKECMICGHQEETVLKQLDHQYVTTVVAPTADSQGYTLHKCSLCGDEYKDQFVAATGNGAIQSVDTSDQTNILLYVSVVTISGMCIVYLTRKKSEL